MGISVIGGGGSSGGIGGSTGATDNRVLRADGAGGATLQNSPLTLSDAGGLITSAGDVFRYVVGEGLGLGDGAAAVGEWVLNIQAITAARTVSVPDLTGTMVVGSATASTVGAAGGASALPATPLGYLTVKLPNGTSVKLPYYTV